MIALRVIRDDDVVIIGGTYRGSTVEIPRCACIAQAIYTATRGAGARADDVHVTDHRGNPVPREQWPTCNVDPRSWVWAHHGFTHHALV